MNSLESFAVGSIFLMALACLALVVFVILKLARANERMGEIAETAFLASKSNNAAELAQALTARDEARANIQILQKELQGQVPLANSMPRGIESEDTLDFGGIPLVPLRR